MKSFVFIISLILCSVLFGQTDTSYSKIQRVELNDLFLIDNESYQSSSLDTSIHNIVDYWNLFDQDRNFIHALNGAYIPLSYEDNRWLNNLPFQFEAIDFAPYIYKTKVPFTRIEGLTGANSQEKFDFLHTQNPMLNWNLGLRYRFSKDESSYAFATSRMWSTQLYSHYASRNKRYTNHFNVTFNQGRHKENFGVDSLTLLQGVIPGSDLLGVNNENAVHENRAMAINLEQKVVLNKVDSQLTLDSLKTHIYLFQNLKYKWESHTFEDENTSFDYSLYPTFIGDSSFIFDSTKVRTFELPLGIGIRNKHFNEEVSIKQYLYKYFSHDSTFNPVQRPYYQTSINNKLLLNIGPHQLRSEGEYTIAGINTGTYQIQNSLLFKGKLQPVIGFNYYSLTQQPFWENFNNAYLTWNKSYEAEEQLMLSFQLSQKWITWRNEFRSIDNRLYFDGSELSQNLSNIQFLKSSVNFQFENESWGFKNRNTVQYTSDSILSVPTYLGKVWIYKKGHLFKKKMQIEIGIDASYNTDYYAPYYSPIMGTLVPQNQNLIKGYPLIGAYFSGKVKRARFYIKGEHLNQGLMGYDYYTTLGFPINGRTLKFGLMMDLFD